MDTPALEQLDELIAALTHVRATEESLNRAWRARGLERRLRAVLGHVSNEAVFHASHELVGVRRRSHQEIADKLGISPHTVSNAISEYRRWVSDGCP
jgi:DNA-directed RNA polymerase specialized sigma24 family protein